MTQIVVIEADGGSRGNPGPAGSGAVLIDQSTGAVLAEIAMFIGVATNNVAEYRAVLAAVDVANEIAPEAELLVRMDSKLVVEQMSGRWKVKNEGMQDLFQAMVKSIGSRKISFEWIPREQNGKADALANEAMDAEKSVVRKFVGSPDTSTISVVTSSSKVIAADLEYNPELPSSVRAPRNVSKKLTTIILVRHGRTILTESHRISGRGGEDPQLSEAGIQDAQAAAEALSKVSHSGAYAKVLKPSIVVSDWDGHTNQEVATNWPDHYEQWRGDVKIAPPGGESLEEFDVRVQQGLADILDKYEGQTVIVVSHVMPIRGFLKNALQAGWPSYWRTSVAPCSISIVRFWGNEAAEITVVNQTHHL